MNKVASDAELCSSQKYCYCRVYDVLTASFGISQLSSMLPAGYVGSLENESYPTSEEEEEEADEGESGDYHVMEFVLYACYVASTLEGGGAYGVHIALINWGGEDSHRHGCIQCPYNWVVST